MITDQVKCDMCGAIKGETNHWLVGLQIANYHGILFVPVEEIHEPRDVWCGKYTDFCGSACAHKRLSQWLETLTTPKDSSNV